MRKINGYLIIGFNARELREWDGTALGNYGVIDAGLHETDKQLERQPQE